MTRTHPEAQISTSNLERLSKSNIAGVNFAHLKVLNQRSKYLDTHQMASLRIPNRIPITHVLFLTLIFNPTAFATQISFEIVHERAQRLAEAQREGDIAFLHKLKETFNWFDDEIWSITFTYRKLDPDWSKRKEFVFRYRDPRTTRFLTRDEELQKLLQDMVCPSVSRLQQAMKPFSAGLVGDDYSDSKAWLSILKKHQEKAWHEDWQHLMALASILGWNSVRELEIFKKNCPSFLDLLGQLAHRSPELQQILPKLNLKESTLAAKADSDSDSQHEMNSHDKVLAYLQGLSPPIPLQASIQTSTEEQQADTPTKQSPDSKSDSESLDLSKYTEDPRFGPVLDMMDTLLRDISSKTSPTARFNHGRHARGHINVPIVQALCKSCQTLQSYTIYMGLVCHLHDRIEFLENDSIRFLERCAGCRA